MIQDNLSTSVVQADCSGKWTNTCSCHEVTHVGVAACQGAKAPPTRNRASNHLYAGRPWQVLAIDLFGPLPQTQAGNNVVLVMTDHFTRWCDAIPLPYGKAATVTRALDERVFAYFGIPERIHPDQRRQFQSELFQACCELWGCEKNRDHAV